MIGQGRPHEPIRAEADRETIVGCTGCVWRPTFSPKDWRPSVEQFRTHIPGETLDV